MGFSMGHEGNAQRPARRLYAALHIYVFNDLGGAILSLLGHQRRAHPAARSQGFLPEAV